MFDWDMIAREEWLERYGWLTGAEDFRLAHDEEYDVLDILEGQTGARISNGILVKEAEAIYQTFFRLHIPIGFLYKMDIPDSSIVLLAINRSGEVVLLNEGSLSEPTRVHFD